MVATSAQTYEVWGLRIERSHSIMRMQCIAVQVLLHSPQAAKICLVPAAEVAASFCAILVLLVLHDGFGAYVLALITTSICEGPRLTTGVARLDCCCWFTKPHMCLKPTHPFFTRLPECPHSWEHCLKG